MVLKVESSHEIRASKVVSAKELQRRENMRTRSLKHGLSRTPAYISWQRMKDRCGNPNHVYFANYGGRGIAVCDRWMDFSNFISDMGERPSGTTLDRINSDGNYEPGNCRWATTTHQARNRRTTKLTLALAEEIRGRVEHGESIRKVAKRLGLTRGVVWSVVSNATWVSP